MTGPLDADVPDFATAFGDALNGYLVAEDLRQSDLVRLLGLDTRTGKARISSYCRRGKRVKPDAEMLYLACSKLPRFSFSYRGYRISAATLSGNGARSSQRSSEQLTFGFERQFKLTDHGGTLAVKIKRPSGRIEVSLYLEARGA